MAIKAPSVTDLLRSPVVRRALERAWQDSCVDNAKKRHEEGGWIYFRLEDGKIFTRRAARGGTVTIDLWNPPILSRCHRGDFSYASAPLH